MLEELHTIYFIANHVSMLAEDSGMRKGMPRHGSEEEPLDPGLLGS